MSKAATRERLRSITEDYQITARESDGEGKGLATIRATLARGNHINRNRRYYSATVLARAAAAATDRVESGQLIGLMDHPNWWDGDGDKGKPERTVIRWNRLWMDGPDLMGEGHIINTALGRDLLGMHEGDVHIGLSTNSYATAHYEPAEDVPAPYDGEATDLIQVIDELELLTVDVVNDPSNVYAAIEREAIAARESYEAERNPDMNELEQAQARIRELEGQVAEQAADLEQARADLERARADLVRQARESIVREAVAQANGAVPQAIQDAAVLLATTAADDDAARESVRELIASATGVNHGNNGVPAKESLEKPKGDPLREAIQSLTQ